MHKAILWLMPRRQMRIAVQISFGLGFAFLGFGLQSSLHRILGGFPLLLFVPAVFFSTIILGKNGGLTTTLAGAALAAYYIAEPINSFALKPSSTLAVVIFVAIGAGMSLVIEALTQAIKGLNEGEATQRLLLDELAHRTKNDLAIISSAITLQRNASPDAAVRKALDAANARVLVVARAQERLRGDKAGSRVDLGAYVSDLCNDLGDLLRDVRPIAVRVTSPNLLVPTALAVNVGLIVNELVTNSLKYAFPPDRGGTVTVNVAAEPGQLVVEVRDDGVGCDDFEKAGLGSKLVKLLAKQLEGTVEREPGDPGYVVRVTLRDAGLGDASARG